MTSSGAKPTNQIQPFSPSLLLIHYVMASAMCSMSELGTVMFLTLYSLRPIASPLIQHTPQS